MELYSTLLLKNLQKVKSNIDITFNAFFLQKEPIVRNLIYRRWLLGKKPDGSLIGFYRDQEYREDKYFKNPLAGGGVDLILTGDLWRAIELFPTKEGIEIFSTDWKFEDIADKYGYVNFNITEKEKEILINEISVITIEFLYKKYIL